MEVSSLYFHRDWKTGTLSFFIMVERISPKSLRKTFLSGKTGKRLGDLHLKGAEKEFTIASVLTEML